MRRGPIMNTMHLLEIGDDRPEIWLYLQFYVWIEIKPHDDTNLWYG